MDYVAEIEKLVTVKAGLDAEHEKYMSRMRELAATESGEELAGLLMMEIEATIEYELMVERVDDTIGKLKFLIAMS